MIVKKEGWIVLNHDPKEEWPPRERTGLVYSGVVWADKETANRRTGNNRDNPYPVIRIEWEQEETISQERERAEYERLKKKFD